MDSTVTTKNFRALRFWFFSGLVFCIFIQPLSIFASHLAGADLTYEYQGNGQYLVTYTLYRDCFGIPARPDQPLVISSTTCNSFQSVTMYPLPNTGQEITYTCDNTLTTCQGGTATGIQEWVYTAMVTLPAQCPDWVFSTTDNARNVAITTIQNPGAASMYLEAYLNNTVFDGSSPTFTNVPVLFECIGQLNNFNHGAIAPNGDSLVYFFTSPLTDANVPVAYNAGYSMADPITSSTPVSIDQNTGDITMTPTQVEVGVMAVLVQQWRGGVLLGTIMRDMQVYTVQCNNTLPSASGINGTSQFSTSVCAGGQLCFDIYTDDADATDSVTVEWNQGIPGATFTVATSGLHPTGHFCWTPTSADVRPQPYTFTVTVHDNACPSNGVRTFSYAILVSEMNITLTSTPAVSCNGGHNGSASASGTGQAPLQYVWTLPGGTELYTPSISHLSAGNYTLNIIDAIGCVGTEYFSITEPSALNLSLTHLDAGCNGLYGEATASVSGGTPGYTYQWNDPAAQTSATATNLSTGTFTVIVRDANQCQVSGSVDILGGNPISASITSTPATCVATDGTASVVVTGGSGDFSYAWTPNVSNGPDATGLMTGVYDVVVTDNVTGCTIALSTIVGNSSGITATIVSSTDATCENGEDGSATVSGSGGIPPYTYLWMPNGDTTASVNNLAPGTYTVAVIDYTGCMAYATVSIGFINEAPVVDLGPDTLACTGTTVTLDAGAGFASYLWSDNSTGQTLDVTSDGTYSVLVTNGAGCENFDAVTVTFFTCPTAHPVVHHPGAAAAVSISPNPAHGTILIHVAHIKDTDVRISISDILGNNVFRSNEAVGMNYNKTVDLQEMPSGIYMVKVEFGDQVNTLRLVKE